MQKGKIRRRATGRSFLPAKISSVLMALVYMVQADPTITELDEIVGSQSGAPAIAVDGNYAYVVFTDDKDKDKGKIRRYDLSAGTSVVSGQLFETIGKDDPNHNDSAIAIDGDGYLHVMIGMHNHFIKYYKSTAPGAYNSFTDLSTSMPGYYDTGLDEKRYSYPVAATASNGDVVFVLRRTGIDYNLNESWYFEKQDLYHYDVSAGQWNLIWIKGKAADGGGNYRDAYMSRVCSDDDNSIHIVTAWAKRHSGDNSFQRATYLKFDLDTGTFHKADGIDVTANLPIYVDDTDGSVDFCFNSGEPWGDDTLELQTPHVAINDLGDPVVSFARNWDPNLSKTDPDDELSVSTWNGSQWVLTDHIVEVKASSRIPITNTGGMINTYSRNMSNIRHIISSTDQGLTWPISYSDGDTAWMPAVIELDALTDLMIAGNYLYEVSYPATGNQPPLFTSDPIVEIDATEDVAYSSSIADDAVDPNQDPLNFSAISGPAWLNVANDGDLTGTPSSANLGLNSWTVQVSDGNGGFDTAALEITVDPTGGGNQPPAFTSDPINKANAEEGTAYSGSISGDASDPESDPMTFSKVSGPAWLSVAANGTLSGTPGTSDVGANVFTVQVDATGGSDTATLNITVDPAGGILTFTALEDASLQQNNPDATGNWTKLEIRGSTGISSIGKFNISSLSSSVSSAKLRLYTATLPAPVVVSAFRATGDSWSESTVTYNNGPTKGTKLSELNVTTVGQYYEFDVTAFINEKVDASATLVTLWVENETGDSTSMEFNSHILANPPELQVQIGTPPANQPPAFTSDPISKSNGTEGQSYSGSIAGDASDPEYDPLTFSKVSGPSWLSVASDGTLSGTPGAGDVGANAFTVQVDATGGSDTATLNITVDTSGGADVITVSRATYNTRKSELQVDASSSGGAGLTLTIVGYTPNMTDDGGGNYSYKKKPVADPGGTITINSSGGGTVTVPVN